MIKDFNEFINNINSIDFKNIKDILINYQGNDLDNYIHIDENNYYKQA